ncbi:MAG: phosphoribosylaminoimidazolesuccinocarboxamide synthase [Deltaproteobacteria bacterium]|nr:phosphoribosylaminoimidazolesuccinocarboxamide synthase [Deltaproteobacteria bacterium]
MDRHATLTAQLSHTLDRADFPTLGTLYRGKVRDNYTRGDTIVMITSDRLSAFDRVLTTVPFKGELLSRLAVFWFEKTRDVMQNHILDVPDPSVQVVRKLRTLPIEVVVRGRLTGSLWRDVQAGKGAQAYGITLDPSMKKDQAFETPILTPSTKEAVGTHDEPISPAGLIARGACTQAQWDFISERALALFARGQEWARSRGLILVDTKYEFGTDAQGKLWLIDEIHTPDSSRYWLLEGSDERFKKGEEQRNLDKEFVRQWLISERGWKGDGPAPEIPGEVRVQLAEKYCALFEQVTGQEAPLEAGSVHGRIERALRAAGML